ncbi:hypothetical protein [Clostridium butyricum]|uniref:hypothetical protein n=1 Tax=Clostridium butyricum TaxID=1492 RepID=UPI002ABDAC21|nr:hypothetical protein [Clostridium butyricum]
MRINGYSTTYVNNTFSAIPETEEIKKLKSEILNRIEKRYNILKSEGKSENEITGIIVSEFSNISELINETLNIHSSAENTDIISNDDSINYYKNNRLLKAIVSAYWPSVVLLYLFVSFTFGNWYVSWLIFILAVVLKNFFCTYFNIETK